MAYKLSLIKLIFFFLIISSVPAGFSQAQDQIIDVSVKEISCPEGRWVEDFYLGPSNQEILVLLKAEVKELYFYRTTNYFSLDEYIPGGRYKRIKLDLKQAETVYLSWLKLKDNQEGIFLNKYQEYFKPYAKEGYSPDDDFGCHFEKKEIWKYKIKEASWERIDWKDGRLLMSDWRSLNSRSPKLVPPDFSIFKNAGFLDKMQVNPDFVDGIYSRKGEKTFLVSDDGDTVLYRLILAKGKIGFYSNLLRRFYRLPERKDYFLMGLGIFGIKSRQHKVLSIAPPNHTISFEKIRWSGDSSCIVLAQSRFENGESPDIFKVIRLKK